MGYNTDGNITVLGMHAFERVYLELSVIKYPDRKLPVDKEL